MRKFLVIIVIYFTGDADIYSYFVTANSYLEAVGWGNVKADRLCCSPYHKSVEVIEINKIKEETVK